MKRNVPILFFTVLMFIMSTSAFSQHFEFATTDVSVSNLVQEALLNGESLVEGDEIGVFTPGGDCAGASVLEGEEALPAGVAAWSAEGNNPGFRDGNEIEFRFWDASSEQEIVAEVTNIVQGDGTWVANAMNVLSLAAEMEDAPDIAFDPVRVNFGRLIAGEEDAITLQIMNAGQVPLTLESVVIEGDEEFTIDYQDVVEEFHWEFNRTDVSMSILVSHANLNGESLVEGDYIGMFNPGGVCSGFSQVTADGFPVGPAAWGAEQGQQNGYRAGDALEYRYWDTAAGMEYVADVEVLNGVDNVWEGNGFIAVNLNVDNGFHRADAASVVIDPDGSFEVPVHFAPGEVGEYTASIIVVSDDPDEGEAVVEVTGSAYAGGPIFSYASNGHNFGDVVIGGSLRWTLNVRNTGGEVLAVESVTTAGDYFSDDIADGFTLEPGAGRGINFDFAPEEAGNFEATSTIITNDPDREEVNIQLVGAGVVAEAAMLVFDPENIDFGEIMVNQQVDEVLHIRNEGNIPLAIDDIIVEGDGFSIDYEQVVPEFNWEFTRTDASMSVLIQEGTIDGESLVRGDYIGLFTEDGVCGGYSMVEEFAVGSAAWGAEQGQNNGFSDGEPIEFRFWQTETGREYVAEIELRNGVEATFSANGFLVVGLTTRNGFNVADVAEEMVEPGESFDVTVTFAPENTGEYAGLVTVFSDDPDSPEASVNLAGFGIASTPEIEVSDEAHDFGNIFLGDSEDWMFTITNTGDAVLTVESVITTGDYFMDDADGAFELDPNTGREIIVTFAPEQVNGFQGAVTIISDDEDEGEIVVSLVGRGVEAEEPNIVVSPASIDFGEVYVDGMETEMLTVHNNGNAPLSITDIVVEGDGFAVEFDNEIPQFNWEYVRTDVSMSVLVAAAELNGESLVQGDYIGLFTENGVCAGYGQVEEFSVGLAAWATEQGQGNGFRDQEAIEFRYWQTETGREYVAQSEIIDGNAAAFTANGFLAVNLSVDDGFNAGDVAEVVIEPDGELEFAVYFFPERVGEHDGMLTVISNDPDDGEVMVDLMGVGIEASPVIRLSENNHDFGDVFIGDAEHWVLTIANDGDGELVVENVMTQGDFFSDDAEGFSVDPGAEHAVNFTFAPGAEGHFQGRVLITSNDPESGELTVELSGVGVQIAEPAIRLDPNELIDFGEIYVNESGEEMLVIHNVGDADLEIEDIVVEGAGFSIDFEQNIPEFNWEFVRTDVSMSCLVRAAELNGEALSPADYIGGFNEAGNCAGFQQVGDGFENNGVGLAVWATEQGQDNGFRDGEPIQYRFWDTDAGMEYIAEVEILDHIENVFSPNGFIPINLVAENRFVAFDVAQETIAPNASLEVYVMFDPTETGEHNGGLTVISNDPENREASIRLFGVGVDPMPEIVVHPMAHGFGQVILGESDDLSISVSNVGDGDLVVESVSIDGDFFYLAEEGGFTLVAGDRQEILVIFEPEEEGNYHGTVTIISNDADEGEVTVALTGMGMVDRVPAIGVNPEAMDFGQNGVGERVEDILYITNIGNAPLNIFDITVEGEAFDIEFDGGGPQEFNWEYATTDGSMSILILSAELQGEDLAVGDYIGVFREDGECGGYAQVEEAGAQIGLAAWQAEANVNPVNGFADGENVAFHYWDTEAGREYQTEMELVQGDGRFHYGELLVAHLTGAEPMALQDIAEVQLAPDETMEVPVYFRPTDAQEYRGEITIVSDDPENDMVTVPLFGEGVYLVEHFQFTVTGETHNVVILSAEIDGESMVRGDEIGVFTPDGLCAGAAGITEQDFPAGMAVWADDPMTDEIDGFRNGEALAFRVWDLSAEMECMAYIDEVIEGPTEFQINGFTQLTLVVDVETLVADLEELEFGTIEVGNTLQESVNITNNGHAAVMVTGIATDDPDHFAVDFEGEFELQPEGSYEIMVTFMPDDAMRFEGTLMVESDAPNQGNVNVRLFGAGIWYPEIVLDPVDLIDFGPVPVNDEREQMLHILNEGQAPLLIDDIIIEGNGFALGEIQGGEPGQFDWEFVATDDNMSIIVQGATLDGESLVEGDVIGVFTDEGMCAGYSYVHAAFPEESVGIAAWAAEQGERNGFQNGHPVEYRYWDMESGREYAAEAQIVNGVPNQFGARELMVVVLAAERGFAPGDIAEWEIEAGGMVDVPVIFTPNEVGDYEGMITVLSNDPQNEEARVALVGAGFNEVDIVVSADAYDFDQLLVGESADWGFTVANAGGADLIVETIVVSGDYFGIDLQEGFTLGNGQQQEVMVSFAPEDAGDFEGTLLIRSNDPDEPGVVVTLTGSAVWFPIIALDPADNINFGAHPVGQQADATLTIMNDGQVPLTVSDFIVEGGAFEIGLEIGEGGDPHNEFDWEYQSTDANMSVLVRNAMINGEMLAEGDFVGVFTENGLCAGIGSVPADLVENQLGFPAWQAEQNADNGFRAGERVEFRMWDTEAGAEVIADVEIESGTGEFEFNTMLVVTLTGERQVGQQFEEVVIEPGGVFDVPVYFTAPDAGDFEGSLTVVSDDPYNGEVTVDLMGAGFWLPAEILVSDVEYNFGNVVVGDVTAWQFTIQNIGQLPLDVDRIALEGEYFSIDNEGGFSLGEGEQAVINVGFAPENRGDFGGAITIFSNDAQNGEVDVNVQGAGLAPVIAVGDERLDFGEVRVDEEEMRILQITNDGDADLIIDDLMIENDVFSLEEQEWQEFHWEFTNTDNNMSILVISALLNDESLVPGDYIGVFTPDGVCAGYNVVGDAFPEGGVGLAAFGAEQGQDNGFEDGAELSFRFWDTEAGREYNADAQFDEGENVYSINSFVVVNLSGGARFERADLVNSIVVQPGSMAEINVYFRPVEAMEYEGSLTILSNDPNDGEVVVGLFGIGIEPNTPPYWVDMPDELQENEGVDFALDVLAMDDEQDPLELSLMVYDGNEEEVNVGEFNWNENGTGTFAWSIGFDAAGDYNLVFTAADDEYSIDHVVHLSVLNVNQAPEWVEVPDNYNIDEGDNVEFTIVGADADGDDLTIAINFENDGYSFEDLGEGRGIFTWQTDNEDAGEYDVEFILADNEEQITTVVRIEIADVNQPPVVVQGIEDIEIDEDSDRIVVADLDDIFFDPDGDDLFFIVPNADDLPFLNIMIDDENVLSLQPDPNFTDVEGSEVWVVADDLRDGQAAVASAVRLDLNAGALNHRQTSTRGVRSTSSAASFQPNRDEWVDLTFVVTVMPVNDAPEVVGDIADVTVDEDAGMIVVADLDDLFEDIDGDELAFGFAGAVEELNMGIDENSMLFFHADDNFNLPDGVEITVTAEDAEAAAELMFVLVITPINDAPVVVEAIADVVVDEDADAMQIADLDDIFFDVDGDELMFNFDGATAELNMGIDEDNVLYFDPDPNYNLPNGIDITVTASDEEGSVDDVFLLTIVPVNDIPVVESQIRDVLIDEDSGLFEIADLDFIFSDVEDEVLNFDFTGNPAALNMGIDEDNVLYINADANFNLPDGVDITVTAEDSEGGAVDEIFAIIIRPINDAPVWVVYPLEAIMVVEGETVEFSLVAEDVDGDDLIIAWSNRWGIPEEALTDLGEGVAAFSWETDFEDEGQYHPVLLVHDGEELVELNVDIVVENLAQLQHFTGFVATNTNHSLIVQDITFDGETVPSMWEVGVFTPGDVLAGAQIWYEDEESIGLAAWGDDRDTQEIEGFRAGETMSFMVWDNDADVEYGANTDIVEGDLTWGDGELTVLSLSILTTRELTIRMRRGWNLISLNIAPGPEMYREGEDRGPDMIYMLDQFAEEDMEDHHIILLKNDRGQFYHPRTGYISRLMTYWDSNEGYNLRTDQELTGVWTGEPIPEDTPIQINNGWNYVPYYPTYNLSAAKPDFYVLAEIIDNVRLAKNTLGKFLAPHVNFSNMPPWTEGQGYQLKMQNLESPIWFVYPEAPQEGAYVAAIESENMHYVDPVVTDNNMSVLITQVAGFGIDRDDEIAAYNVDGKYVGSGTFDANGMAGLAVWGDDVTTEVIDGLKKDEAFELRLWDADRKLEINLTPIGVREGKGLVYEADGFTMLDLGLAPEIPDNYYLSKAYPNPFNATTHLSFGLPEAGVVSVKVFDMSGRLVSTLVDGTIAAGTHSIMFGGADMPSGVYMVRMVSTGFKTSQKVVLMR